MIQKKTEKVWYDHKGTKVPRKYVPDFDRKNEIVVGRIFNNAETLSNKLRAFKNKAFEDADKMYSEMLKNADIEQSERKGNYTLTSFNKSVKIEVNVSETMRFNDNIEFAQIKFNEFITLKTESVDPELAEIVNNSFKTRKGKLDTKRVFSLFSYKITHPKWLEGLELIKKAMYVDGSVRYMEISTKGINGKFEIVKLNFSSI